MSDPCKFCGKTFSTKGNLTKHIPKCKKNTQKPEKPYKCEFCDATFNTEPELSKHEMDKCRVIIPVLKKEIGRLQNVEILLQERDATIIELTKKIQYLEGTIKGMKNGRTINNVQNNNIVQYKLGDLPINQVKPFTVNEIKAHLKQGGYTYEMFERGFDGLLELFDNIVRETTEDGVERNYVCLDSTRLKFYRLTDARLWESDLGGFYIEKFIDCVYPRYEPRIQKKYNRIKDLENELKLGIGDAEIITAKKNNIEKFINKHRKVGLTLEMDPEHKKMLANKLRNEIKKRYSIDVAYNPDGEDLY